MKKAITLVELLVSLGILALSISLSAAFIKWQQPNLELDQAARELRAALFEARSRALTEQRPYQVHFTMADNQYELAAVASSTVRTILLPAAVRYDQVGPFPNDAVIFNAGGGAEVSGAISLLNRDSRRKTIIINPSGYIKVE